MDDMGARIIEHLGTVAHERRLRQAEPGLGQKVHALKAYQQQRFRHTYADLMVEPRYRPAALFFLQELYGPEDFTRRDEQFVRIVGPLVRLFPRETVRTVERLAALHAMSERLDTAMARHAPSLPWSRASYVRAWQEAGHVTDRGLQVDLLLDVGSSLDRMTRNPLLRHSLRAMRGPAKAAGLADLQSFLESGFDTFRQMRGAADFLRLVQARERRLCERLFAPNALEAAPAPGPDDPLGQLP